MLKSIRFNDKNFIFSCVAVLVSVAALATFLIDPGDYRSPVTVAIATLIAIAANVVFVFFRDPFGFLPTAAAALNFGSLIVVIASQLNNVAMLTTGVGLGNSGVPVTFWFSAAAYLVSTVLSAVNAFSQRAN